MNAKTYAESLGISYRRLDYWAGRGLIFDDPAAASPGSGISRRELSAHEALRLRIMAELVQGGMTPVPARLLAERLMTDGHATIGPSRWLTVMTESALEGVSA